MVYNIARGSNRSSWWGKRVIDGVPIKMIDVQRFHLVGFIHTHIKKYISQLLWITQLCDDKL